MGIEPTWPAWKAGALPLSYTRVQQILPAKRLLSMWRRPLGALTPLKGDGSNISANIFLPA